MPFFSTIFRGVHTKTNDAFPPPIYDFALFQNISVWENFSHLFPGCFISSTKNSDDLFYSLTLNSQFPPYFHKIYVFLAYFTCFFSPPRLTMMHLSIIQCAYILSGHPFSDIESNESLKSFSKIE